MNMDKTNAPAMYFWGTPNNYAVMGRLKMLKPGMFFRSHFGDGFTA